MRRPLRSGLGSRGFLSAGTAVVLVVSSLAMVAGSGFDFGETKLRDGVTWIFDRKKGEAVRVNGSSGKVDMKIALPGAKGKDLEMVQRNNEVMVVDPATGQVASLDTNSLKVSKRVDFGDGKAIDTVMGEGTAYVTNKVDGTVQRVDSAGSMELLGEPFSVGKGLTDGVSDAAGRLWLARNATGEIIRVDPSGDDGLGEGVRRKLADPGAQLEITVTDDGIVVTDAKTGKQWRLDADGKEIGSYEAVVPATPPPPDVRYTPEASTGPYVPITTDDDGPAVAPPPYQPGGGGDPVQPVPVEGSGPKGGYDAADPAVTLGDRIYVPVPGESVLLVLDRTGHYLDTIEVPGEGGFQLILDDGRLWVNDPDDPEVLRIEEDGTVTTVEKSADDVPVTPPKEEPKPPKDDDEDDPKPPTDGGNDPAPTTTTTTLPPATTTTLPPPPVTSAPPVVTAPPAPTTTVKNPDPPAVTGINALGGDATVSLTWSIDTGGGKMRDYAISWKPKAGGCGQPGQQKARPNAVGATVGGLANECAYEFTVLAQNETAKSKPARASATPASEQIPAPAAPAAVTNHGDASTTVSWAPPTDTKGQTVASYLVFATDGQGNRVQFDVGADQNQVVAGASPDGAPGTLVLGRTYTFTLGVGTTKGTKSPQSAPSGPTEVYAGASGVQILSKQRQSAQVWVVTVQANWRGRVGSISAAGGATGNRPNADGPQTFEVQVPWGQSANFTFQADVEGAPSAQVGDSQPNPLPTFTGGPDAVWGACSTNPDIPSDQVHENGYWQIGIDFSQGSKDYVDEVQSSWAYAYGRNQPRPTQGNEGFGTPPTRLEGTTIRTNGRRHYPDYTFFVQFRFKMRGSNQWITSSMASPNAPAC
ncbi:hypothetical protein BH10ACT1_BH10ACT1_41000 [soil metagenome]